MMETKKEVERRPLWCSQCQRDTAHDTRAPALEKPGFSRCRVCGLLKEGQRG